MTTSSPAVRHLLTALLASSSWGCHAITQRWPSPVAPMEPGEGVQDIREFSQGPEEVLILRHADPVRVRPSGQKSSYPLRFYDKDVRVLAGSWVLSDPGGRAEILWPGGSSVTVFGNTTAVVGSPSRGFPTLVFLELERARIDMREEDRIELIGGAILKVESGPVVVDRVRPDIMRVNNQSRGLATVEFREATFVLDPGQIVDLPLLTAGVGPIPVDSERVTVRGPGFTITTRGAVESREVEGGVAFHVTDAGAEEHDIRGMGVEVELANGVEAQFVGPGALGKRRGETTPPPPALSPGPLPAPKPGTKTGEEP